MKLLFVKILNPQMRWGNEDDKFQMWSEYEIVFRMQGRRKFRRLCWKSKTLGPRSFQNVNENSTNLNKDGQIKHKP